MTLEEETDQLRVRALERMEELCRYLLPLGRKEGRRWCAGSAKGEPGRSFDVNLGTGVFGDWAGGEMRQGAIDLWMEVRQMDFKAAADELADWLGRSRSPRPARPVSIERSAPRPKSIRLPDNLQAPTADDIRRLAESRAIAAPALRIAAGRGLWFCFDDERNGRCWLITDKRRRCASRPRIDDERFIVGDGRRTKAAASPGSDMTGPIGYLEAESFPCIGIVEGGPNALAVLGHACAHSVEERVAPICMPCSQSGFTTESLRYLQGKRARIFVDNDPPGWKAAQGWALQLHAAGIAVDAYSFEGLIKSDGSPVKDVNDPCQIDVESWEQNREAVEAIVDFASEGAAK